MELLLWVLVIAEAAAIGGLATWLNRKAQEYNELRRQVDTNEMLIRWSAEVSTRMGISMEEASSAISRVINSQWRTRQRRVRMHR